MKLGFALPMCGAWATPENQVQVARRAEDLGYSSLWTLQRLLYPVRPRNDYPPMAGKPWPDAFYRVLDPVVSIAHVAATTSRIRLGTAVLVAPYYPPVTLAKQLATLDQVAGGRLVVGLGLGWSMDEYAASGVPFAHRGERMDEFVRCLRALLDDEIVAFDGEYYTVPSSYVEPKPAQSRLPMLIGGYGKAAVRRAAALGDGFIGGNLPLATTAALVTDLHEQFASCGRDPLEAYVVCRGVVSLRQKQCAGDRLPLTGAVDEIRQDFRAYEAAGLDELFIELNYDPTIGALDADPDESVARALELMEVLIE